VVHLGLLLLLLIGVATIFGDSLMAVVNPPAALPPTQVDPR
jgi:hypothetical protein